MYHYYIVKLFLLVAMYRYFLYYNVYYCFFVCKALSALTNHALKQNELR
jgi:hypothetical protein